jgi:hypothetical protein
MDWILASGAFVVEQDFMGRTATDERDPPMPLEVRLPGF